MTTDNSAITKTLTIASGTATPEIDLGQYSLVGIYTPASLVSTSLTFTAAPNGGGTHATIKNTSNTAISVTVDSSAAYYALAPDSFAGIRFLKIVTSASETNKVFMIALKQRG